MTNVGPRLASMIAWGRLTTSPLRGAGGAALRAPALVRFTPGQDVAKLEEWELAERVGQEGAGAMSVLAKELAIRVPTWIVLLGLAGFVIVCAVAAFTLWRLSRRKGPPPP